jgi:hypothetical protein
MLWYFIGYKKNVIRVAKLSSKIEIAKNLLKCKENHHPILFNLNSIRKFKSVIFGD